MKRLALVAALAVLPACTTLHPDRRVLTEWNWGVVEDNAVGLGRPSNKNDWDDVGNPIIRWVFVEPIAVVMLPISWLGDTLIVNPINGFQKAELQVYNRRFADDDEKGTSEAALTDGYQFAPMVPPPQVGDLLALPEFVAHWVWNSTYWTDPVNKESWNTYWNEHHEQMAR